MSNHYLAILENIDGCEELACLYGEKEVKELLDIIQGSTYALIGIQQVNVLHSIHNLKEIINLRKE